MQIGTPNHPPQGQGLPTPGLPTPGVPAPGVPAPGVQPFAPQAGVMPGGPANVTTAAINLEDQIAVVGFIASQTNYLKQGVIKTKEAKTIYDDFYKVQSALEANDPNKVETVRNVVKPDGSIDNEKDEELVDKYSVVRFRTFCTDAWNEMKAKNYCEVVLAEARAAYLVIKAIIPEGANNEVRSSITNQLSSNADYRGKDTFIVKESKILNFIGAANIRAIKIYNDIEQMKDNADPDGYVIIESREVQTGKHAGQTRRKTRYAKISKEVETYDKAYIVTYPKEVINNYAVNQDMTEDHGKICASDDLIINLANFEKVFGTGVSPSKEYGYQVKFTRDNPRFQGESDPAAAAKAAKQETFINPGHPRWAAFEALGLDEKVVERIRSTATATGPKPVDLIDLLSDSHKAAQQFMQSKNQ